MNERIIEKQKVAGVNVRRITVTAVFAALITLMTAYLLHIPVGGNGGYIHMGDTLIYLAAATLPLPYACAAGAIGGGLADLLTSPVWAPATIIIKILICLPFSSRGSRYLTRRNVAALLVSGIISMLGYYLAEGLMFGFTVAFLTSAAGSVIQSGGSAILFLILAGALDKLNFKQRLMEMQERE